jgi:peptidoglycan/LPS O-acetylase OafA/YrhL
MSAATGLAKPTGGHDISPARPPTFKGIEGLRAWLAWTVVASHVAQHCGYGDSEASFVGRQFEQLGSHAVSLFIIISGFVITHMVLTKREPYSLYIARRALRIFPAYLICLVLAIPTPLMVVAISNMTPWADPLTASLAQIQVTQFFFPQFFTHLALHLSLLHGILPNGLLPQSQFQFLGPAWSLSLEWQFYLLAPLWIAAQRRWITGSILIPVIVLGWILFQRGNFGNFFLPSLIFGAGPYFLAGIMTRLALGQSADRADGSRRALMLLGVSFFLIAAIGYFAGARPRGMVVSICLWMVVVYLVIPSRNNRRFPWLRILDGRLATEAGKRSYAVYVFHWPVVISLAYIARIYLDLGQHSMVLLVGSLTMIITAVGAELLFRFVEQPAINFGKRLSWPARRSPGRQPELGPRLSRPLAQTDE